MEVLQAVILAVVPILATVFIQWINSARKEVLARTENEVFQRWATEINESVSTAVAYTSQVYVDAIKQKAIKQKGVFSKQDQIDALNMAKKAALDLLSADAKKFITSVYGDIGNFLAKKIEEQVFLQKGE